MQIKPKGGTICIQSGGAAAANHNERMQGIRDTLVGDEERRIARRAPDRPERLDGSRRLSALHQRRLPARRCSRWRTSSPNIPNLDAFTPTGGFPQFLPDAYEKVATKYKDKIASGALALVVADTLPVQIDLMKKGLSAGQVGQRPFEMGYKAMYFLKDIKDGKAPPADPTYTGLDVCTPKTADTCVGG